MPKLREIANKKTLVLILFVFIMLFYSQLAFAYDARHNKKGTILIKKNEVINEDLYVAGDKIIINGTVNGDVLATGDTIIIRGYIRDSAMAIGKNVTISGNIGHGLRVAGFDLIIDGNVGGDLVVAGSKINMRKNATIGGSILFVGSEVGVDGLINENIVGSGSLVTIKNKIMGNAQLKAKTLTLMKKAYIDGDLTYTSENEAIIKQGARVKGVINNKLIESKTKIMKRNASFIIMNTFIKQGFKFLPLFL